MDAKIAVNPCKLIAEVKKHRILYDPEVPSDREEKLQKWKEIGANLYPQWSTFSKATAYDIVLQLQRKWRSYRDAYTRELRARRTGVRVNQRVYIYFKRLTFLGGYDGEISPDEEENCIEEDLNMDDDQSFDEPPPKKSKKIKKKKKEKVKKENPENNQPDEMEMPIFPVDTSDDDSDKLFLLSFLPEMRQLPAKIKMWARAQVASVMQEAVTCHYNNTIPGSVSAIDSGQMKRRESSD